jgi:hypothetical protein
LTLARTVCPIISLWRSPDAAVLLKSAEKKNEQGKNDRKKRINRQKKQPRICSKNQKMVFAARKGKGLVASSLRCNQT